MRPVACLFVIGAAVVMLALALARPRAQGAGEFPPEGPIFGRWAVELNVPPGNDPGNLQDVIQMPGNRQIRGSKSHYVDGSWIYELVAEIPWIGVSHSTSMPNGTSMTKEPDGEWAISLNGTGKIAGYQNVSATFTGHISADGSTLTGLYALGENGALPGGQAITYQVKPKPAGTPQPTATP
jgi:hypothetical protein